jgi:branched-chain amino acid transport system permease protein
MGDSEVAAEAMGINLRRFKLLVFAVSSFLAGIGGALFAEQAHVFSGQSYDPLTSLEWFTVVIVAGVGSLEGAVIGAVVFELLDVFLPGHNSSTLIIALGALFLAYLPGGSLAGMRRKAAEFITAPLVLQRLLARSRRPAPVEEPIALQPSAFAQKVLQP